MSSAGFVYIRITGLTSIRTVGTNLVKSLRNGLTKIRPLQATYLQYIALWYVCLIYDGWLGYRMAEYGGE